MGNIKRPAGFTLIELLIVISAIGVLAVITAPSISRNFLGASQALAFESTFNKLNTQWMMIVITTNTTYSTANTPILGDSANDVLDVLVHGDSPAGLIASDYASLVEQSGVKQASYLKTETAPAVGAPGTYSFGGHPMTYSVDATGLATLTFSDVATSDVERLHSKRSGVAFNPGSANTTGPVQWTAATAGTHTLTLQTLM